MTNKKPKKNPSNSAATSSCAAELAQDSTHFSQKELRKLSFEVSARWFNSEPTPRLTLSVVHPWRIHAYWHISAVMMKEALAVTPAPHALVIRIIDLTPAQGDTKTEQVSFDIEVDGLDNNWYIDLWQPGKHYVAELGLRGADDKLHLFARSNKIQLPNAEPSPVLDFKVAQYKHSKPLKKMQAATEPAYSISHLTPLLPPFSGFLNKNTGETDKTPSESSAKGAPLRRLPNTPITPTKTVLTAENAATREQKTLTESSDETPPLEEQNLLSKHFPMVSAENRNTVLVDDDTLPKLPVTDPLTISPNDLAINPAALLELPASPSTLPKWHAPASPYSPTAETDSTYRESHIAIQKVAIQKVTAPKAAAEKSAAFPQIGTEELAAYHTNGDILKAAFTAAITSDLPASVYQCAEPASVTNTAVSDTSANLHDEYPQPPTQTVTRPVVKLEDSLSESFFSAATSNRKLRVSVQLELSGKSDADQLLTLFGKPVETDEEGHFSIQLKLDKGPGLAALICAHRHDAQEDN